MMPAQRSTYILFIDEARRFRRAKALLLKWLLTLCEWLAN
jgi:hypothetical protein